MHADLRSANADNQIVPEFGTAILPRIAAWIANNPGIKQSVITGDALAAEMEPHGVSVSVVEPGNYKSNIRRSSVSREFEQVEAAGGEVTEEMKKAYEGTAKRELSYKEPDEVSEAFMHALFDDNPLLRYMVVPNEEEQGWTIQAKINELVQLNQWGPYSYSRDELVGLLDGALAGDAPAE